MGIPLQRDMDMTDLRQSIKWTLVSLAGIILPSEEKLDEVADALISRGVRFIEELQTEWFIPPHEGASWLEQSRGRWVKGKAPGVPPDEYTTGHSDEIDEMIGMLTEEQRTELIARLGGGTDGG